MIVHRSRRAQAYYLHEGKTASGKTRYFCSLRKDGTLAQSIPEGFEVYENPHAQVFLRRKVPRLVTDEELRQLEDGVRRLARIDNAIVDTKRDTMTVFLPDQEVDELMAIMRPVVAVSEPRAREVLSRCIDYSPKMRFRLSDVGRRLFDVDRMTYLGKGGWCTIGYGKPLTVQVRKFCRHLGKESFFELI
jgi:hypothetical protein